MRSDETPGTADRRSACTRAVEALGHDVERDEPFLLGGGQARSHLGTFESSRKDADEDLGRAGSGVGISRTSPARSGGRNNGGLHDVIPFQNAARSAPRGKSSKGPPPG